MENFLVASYPTQGKLPVLPMTMKPSEPAAAAAEEALRDIEQADTLIKAARQSQIQLHPKPAHKIAAQRLKTAALKKSNDVADAKAGQMSWQNINKEVRAEAKQLVASHLSQLKQEELADAREARERMKLYAEADARAEKQGAALANAMQQEMRELDELASSALQGIDDTVDLNPELFDALDRLEASFKSWVKSPQAKVEDTCTAQTWMQGDAATSTVSSHVPNDSMTSSDMQLEATASICSHINWEGKGSLGDALQRLDLTSGLELLSRAVELPYLPWRRSAQRIRPWATGYMASKIGNNVQALQSLRQAELDIASVKLARATQAPRLRAVSSTPTLRKNRSMKTMAVSNQPWQGGYNFDPNHAKLMRFIHEHRTTDRNRRM